MNTKQQQQPATLLPSYETLMAQAQVFASAWAIFGSRFDLGGIKVANQEKANLADMFRRLLTANDILHAENESLRTGYDAARQEIASLTAQHEGGKSKVPPPSVCVPPLLWNKRGQAAYRRGWEEREAAGLSAPFTEADVEAIREKTFSVDTPIDSALMLRATRAIEAAQRDKHGR